MASVSAWIKAGMGLLNPGRRDVLKATALAGAGLALAQTSARGASGEKRDAAGKTRRLKGVLAPAVTPFRAEDRRPDSERYVRHCKWLLSHGCAGLAVFGTNSEANSMSVEEREALLRDLVGGGIDPADLMPGTGACDLPSAIRLTRGAVSAGVAGVLMLPPFYYKNVPDDGLFRYFSEVVQGVGDSRLRIYLYHIPGVSGVPIPLGVIERLVARYQGTVAGIKDSGNDFAFTQTVQSAVGQVFDVFVGSEQFLLQNLRAGGVGCISATANVNPGAIDALFRAGAQAPDAERQQADLNVIRSTFASFPMIPALKWAISHYGGDPAWRTVRPPWTELTASQGQQLAARLDAVGFAMPGLKSA